VHHGICAHFGLGWTREEVEVLRVAIMKFGVGKWTDILSSNCLPGKTPAQLNLQTQRALGQQSLRGVFCARSLSKSVLLTLDQSLVVFS